MKVVILFFMVLRTLLAMDTNMLKTEIKEAYLKEYKDLKLEIETINLEIP
ncbi:flagella basal body P-ring formation protein FlgA, partial [Helicobacter pylori]